MPTGLLDCAHCDGAPLFIAGRLQAVIACEECGISTPPVSNDPADPDSAFRQLSAIWNRRELHRPAHQETISILARRVLTAADIPYFLNVLASTSDNWPANGPKFAAMAAALASPEHPLLQLEPVETVMADAHRYRKLLRRATVIDVDGSSAVHFEPVPGTPTVFSEEDGSSEGRLSISLESFVASALDAIPHSVDT